MSERFWLWVYYRLEKLMDWLIHLQSSVHIKIMVAKGAVLAALEEHDG